MEDEGDTDESDAGYGLYPDCFSTCLFVCGSIRSIWVLGGRRIHETLAAMFDTSVATVRHYLLESWATIVCKTCRVTGDGNDEALLVVPTTCTSG